MPARTVNLGASALYGLRQASAITQEDLAERAGMSVRAIRDLENGRTDAPRHATLLALSSALGLDDARTRAFVDSWSSTRRLATFAELSLAGHDVETLLALEANVAAGLTDLAVFEESIIGADRRLQSNTNLVCASAPKYDVESRIQLWMEQPGLDSERVSLTALTGCRVATRTVLPEHGITAFELEFSRPIRKGESRTFSFRLDLDWAAPPSSDAELATLALHGFRRQTGLYAQRILFADAVLPTRCWQLTRLSSKDITEQPVRLHGTLLEGVHQHLEVGSYGFRWEW